MAKTIQPTTIFQVLNLNIVRNSLLGCQKPILIRKYNNICPINELFIKLFSCSAQWVGRIFIFLLRNNLVKIIIFQLLYYYNISMIINPIFFSFVYALLSQITGQLQLIYDSLLMAGYFNNN